MRRTISSRDRSTGWRRAVASLMLVPLATAYASAQLPPENARASMLPVQASGRSGQDAGQAVGIKLPAVILLAPSSSVSLPIEVTPADIGQRGVLVRIRGLPEAISLNEGHSIAPGSWAVPIATLPRLRVIVPAGLSGKSTMTVTLVTIDGSLIAEAKSDVVIAAAGLIAKDQPAREATPPRPQQSVSGEQPAIPKPALIEVAPTGSVAAAPPQAIREASEAGRPPERRPPTPPTPPAEPPSAQPAAAPAVAKPTMDAASRQRAETLMKRGQALLAEGNIVSARLFFERAANEGLAEAALALGATYDPSELTKLLAQGVRPDPAMARRWYEKAAVLGSDVATKKIERLPK